MRTEVYVLNIDKFNRDTSNFKTVFAKANNDFETYSRLKPKAVITCLICLSSKLWQKKKTFKTTFDDFAILRTTVKKRKKFNFQTSMSKIIVIEL